MEEAVTGVTLTIDSYKGRVLVVGQTEAGELLSVVLAPEGEGNVLYRHRSTCWPPGAPTLQRKACGRNTMSPKKARVGEKEIKSRIPEFK